MSSSIYDPEKFRVSANDYLGSYYNDHRSKMVSLCLSNPTLFNKAKAKVLELLKREIVDQSYDLVFNALSKGEVNRKQIYGGILELRDYPIRYPSHLINDEALSFSSSINHLLTDIVDIIMPEEINQLANAKLSQIGKDSLFKAKDGAHPPPFEG